MVECYNVCGPNAAQAMAYPPCPPCPPVAAPAGEFDDATDWTLSGGASITGGELVMDGSGAGLAMRTSNIPITPGDYHYSFDLVATAGTAQVNVIIGGTSQLVPGSTVVGHYEGTVDSAASSQQIGIGCPSCAVTIDNYVVSRV